MGLIPTTYYIFNKISGGAMHSLPLNALITYYIFVFLDFKFELHL